MALDVSYGTNRLPVTVVHGNEPQQQQPLLYQQPQQHVAYQSEGSEAGYQTAGGYPAEATGYPTEATAGYQTEGYAQVPIYVQPYSGDAGVTVIVVQPKRRSHARIALGFAAFCVVAVIIAVIAFEIPMVVGS